MIYDSSFFIDALFRIINLIVLIFLLAYLFKNYLLESIKTKIEERRQQMRSLEEHLLAVEHQRDLISAMINKESGQSLQMQKKILRWAEVVVVELKMQNRQKEQIVRKIEAQALQKEEALMRAKAQMVIVPQAIRATELKLKNEFADPKLAAQVTARVMTMLRDKKQ